MSVAPNTAASAEREALTRVLYDWVRDDATVGLQMLLGPEVLAKLADRILAPSAPDPAGLVKLDARTKKAVKNLKRQVGFWTVAQADDANCVDSYSVGDVAAVLAALTAAQEQGGVK